MMNLPFAGSDSLRDLSTVDSVVHEEKFNILFIADKQLLEAVWKKMSGLMVLLGTNLWHFLGSLHSPSGEAIDTSNLSMGSWLFKVKTNLRKARNLWYLRQLSSIDETGICLEFW